MGVVSAAPCMLALGIALLGCSQRQPSEEARAPASTRDEAKEMPPRASEADARVHISGADAGDSKSGLMDGGHRDGGAPSMGVDAALDAGLSDPQSVADSGQKDDGGSCSFTGLGVAVVDHACLHAEHGPFMTVMGARDSEAAPLINRPHTGYQIGGEAQDYRVVRYEPRKAGQYALFVEGGVLRTLTLGASESSALFSGQTSCAGLARVAVFELSGGVSYALTLEPSDEAPVLVVIEGLEAFGSEAWRSSCACLAAAELCAAEVDCCSGNCEDGRCVPPQAPVCRSFGPCSTDEECCDYCHDYDHCH